MKISKLAIICAVLALQGCSSYYKSGFVMPVNSSEAKDYDRAGYRVQVWMEIKEEVHPGIKCHRLTLELPQWIKDENCGTMKSGKFTKVCDPDMYLTKNDKLFVRLGGKPYTPEFLKNLDIVLVMEGKEYKGTIVPNDPYRDYHFPVSIKQIEENPSYLLVTHKDYERIIPIKYEMKSYKIYD